MNVAAAVLPFAPPPVPSAALDHESLGRSLRQAFHSGDGWRTLSVADRLLDEHSPSHEDLAMRGEALRHLRAPWRSAIDLLAARSLAALAGEPEAPWIRTSLACLRAELSLAGQSGGPGPMPEEALSLIDERVSIPGVGRAVLEALAALPHGQGHALAARAAVVALAAGDQTAARAAAETALRTRPDDATTFVVAALAAPMSSDDETLERLEEAWRRLVLGPVDEGDTALLSLARSLRAVSQEALAERRLDALAARGFHEERVAVADEALTSMPWSIAIGTHRACAHAALGDHAASVEAFSAVLVRALREGCQATPEVTRCRYLRAGARVRLGDHIGALADLEVAIGRDRDLVEAALADDDLAPLHDDPRFEALCRGTLGALTASQVGGLLAPS